MAALGKNIDVLRAEEYLLIGLRVDARRAWRRVAQSLDETGLVAASVLAHQWGWHDRAIDTISKTPYKRDLSLRFPTPYKDKVDAVAHRSMIKSNWIYGVMRRESAFISDIRSSAGAIGLMQLLPDTASYVARKLGQTVRKGDLIDENLNIALGSQYLRQLMNRFKNNLTLATAAYNAGPNRVAKWLPRQKLLPADVWIDTIPFTETRRYVRAVLAYTTIYEWREKGRSQVFLRQSMTGIPAFP